MPSLIGTPLDERDRCSDQADEDVGVFAPIPFLVIKATLNAITNLASQAPARFFSGPLQATSQVLRHFHIQGDKLDPAFDCPSWHRKPPQSSRLIVRVLARNALDGNRDCAYKCTHKACAHEEREMLT